MTISDILTIIGRNNIPYNAKIESDSGWECGATAVDGVYYNKCTNTIVLVRRCTERSYHEDPDWVSIV